MSSQVYPTWLPGLLFTQSKVPVWSTNIQTAISGKESRQARRGSPVYKWELQYEFLQDPLVPRKNYIPYSQDLTQWSGSSGSSSTDYVPLVVPNQATDPISGALTADQVILNKGPGTTVNDSSTLAFATIALSAGTYTVSIWLRTLDGTTVTVNLVGLFGVGGSGGTLAATVTPTWQRFALTGTVASAGTLVAGMQLQLKGTTSSSSYANIAAWGAQVEAGSFATLNIPTYGAADTSGDLQTLIAFVNLMQGAWDTFLYQDPQFNTVALQQFGVGTGAQTVYQLTANYSPDGASGFNELIQNTNGAPQIYLNRYGGPELQGSASRTNLALHSSLGSGWAASNMTVTANATTGPDGTADATSLNEGTNTGVHDLALGSIAVTGGAYYNFSVFVKYSSAQFVEINFDNGSTNGFTANFDIQNGIFNGFHVNGTAYPVAASIVPFGTSGWYRISISGVLTPSDTTARVAIVHAQNSTPTWYPSYTGTSQLTYAWGAQLETGVLPTALIPTTTGSASATDYSIGSTGVITYNVAPPNQALLEWSGSFYYRVRFDSDEQEVDQLWAQMWEAKKVDLQQVKL